MDSADLRLRAHSVFTGLLDAEGPTCAAASCARAASCWASVEDERRPPPAPRSRGQAYRPWIGERYDATRLFIVGERHNDHGGWESAVGIVA